MEQQQQQQKEKEMVAANVPNRRGQKTARF
jgi:hypothetical protein